MSDLTKKGRCKVCDSYQEFKYNSVFAAYLCQHCESSYWPENADFVNESVNHPAHYQSEKFEVIEIIEAFKLNFALGNAIKYILRAEKKDDYIEDLKKAAWYIEREIKAYADE